MPPAYHSCWPIPRALFRFEFFGRIAGCGVLAGYIRMSLYADDYAPVIFSVSFAMLMPPGGFAHFSTDEQKENEFCVINIHRLLDMTDPALPARKQKPNKVCLTKTD